MARLRSLLALVLALVAHAAFGATAEPPLVATLKLEPDHSLPGIPVALRFTFINRSNRDVTLPSGILLQVAPPKGAPFFARWRPWHSHNNDPGYFGAFDEVYNDLKTLKANESASRLAPVISTLHSPAIGIDPRLFSPGTYNVRAILFTNDSPKIQIGAADQVRERTLQEVLNESSEAIVTNEVGFLVDEPKGEDAIVWRRLLEATGGWQWGPPPEWLFYGTAREIWEQHPGSRYAPYMGMLLLPKSESERRSVIERVREMDENNPLLDAVPLGTAESDARLSAEVLRGDRDINRAIALAQRAREEFEAVLEESHNDVIRLLAMKELAALPTADQLREKLAFISQFDPPPPRDAKAVRPLIQCVKSAEDGLTVWFGYDNPNDTAVSLAVGSRNRFDPPPQDRGQPTRFRPGRHDKVFKVAIAKQASLVWVLDGTSVTLNVSASSKCQDDETDDRDR